MTTITLTMTEEQAGWLQHAAAFYADTMAGRIPALASAAQYGHLRAKSGELCEPGTIDAIERKSVEIQGLLGFAPHEAVALYSGRGSDAAKFCSSLWLHLRALSTSLPDEREKASASDQLLPPQCRAGVATNVTPQNSEPVFSREFS